MSSKKTMAAARPQTKGKVTFTQSKKQPVASGSLQKRKRVADPASDDEDDDMEDEGEDDEEEGEAGDSFEEADTDEEIAAAQSGKSKKTAKRKRRATSPSTFGVALETLLAAGTAADDEEKPQKRPQKGQSTILSLAPHVRRSAQSSRLNAKASRLALEARRKREDRARVKDVIGAWGPPGQPPKTETGEEKEEAEELEIDESEQVKEWRLQGGAQGYEKKLRKVAQRGVVKLFNAIRAAQNTTESDVEDGRGAKEETPVSSKKTMPNNSLKSENALGGKGKAVHELSRNNFFDLIRGGTKAAAH